MYNPVDVAEFRTSEVPFDAIIKTVKTMIQHFPLEERNRIISSWDRDRENLERTMRRRHHLGRMDIEAFPKQEERVEPSDTLMEPLDDMVLRGNICDEVVDDGDTDEVICGTDVVVYTRSVSQRPWVGRVVEILPNEEVSVHWYTRQPGRRGQYHASFSSDGSPLTGAVSLDSLLFWDMSEDVKETSFYLSNYWLEIIKSQYLEMDQMDLN